MMHEQFEALKRLYTEYKQASLQIDKLIFDENYDEIENVIRNKGLILEHIINQEKIVQLNNQEKLEQEQIKEEIAVFEEKNIKNLSKIKDEIKKELNKVNKNANLHKAYAIFQNDSGAIVDTME